MTELELDTLADLPTLQVQIGGRPYRFSELPLKALARLQSWIRANTPNPLEALKGQLEGFDPADRAALLESARLDALSWPPRVGTAAGAAALLGTEPGQVEALRAGLSVHHPELAEGPAVVAVFRAMRKDASREAKAAKDAGLAYDGEGTAKRIFAVLFGLGTGEDDDPKSDGPPSPDTIAGRIGP